MAVSRNDRAWTAGLLIVLALAAFLRFDGLGDPSLWLDEILHVEQARQAVAEAALGPWYGWWNALRVDPENGPLYYATQVLSLSIFDGEVGARLMPALTGTATVLVLCLVGRAATGRRTVGLVAGCLIALSPLHVYYAREGRPYAGIMLAAAMLLLLALRSRHRWARVAAYPVAIGTACLGAISAPILVASAGLACLSFVLFRRRGAHGRRGHLAIATCLALVLLPLLFPRVEAVKAVVGEDADLASSVEVETNDSKHSEDVEITRPLSKTGLERLAASLTVSGLDSGATNWRSWLFIGMAFWGGVVWPRRMPMAGVWMVGMCLLPIAGGMALLAFFDHWYNVRYTSSGLPAFLLLAAAGMVDVGDRLRGMARPSRGILRPAIGGAAIVGVLALVAIPNWGVARTEAWQKPPWRDVAHVVGSMSTDDEIVIARDDWARVCLRYYLERLGYPTPIAAMDFDADRARAILEGHAGAFVVAAGYRKGVWLQTWLGSLDLVLDRPEANIRLYYAPDFSTLFSVVDRGVGVARDGHAVGGVQALARLGHQIVRQDFTGDEALLGPGWSSPEVDPSGVSFRWAAASHAEIAVVGPLSGNVAKPGGASRRGHDRALLERALYVRSRPFPSAESPPQRVTVTVNGQTVAAVEMAPGWQEWTVPYTSDRIIDHVRFDFEWLRAPRDENSASQDGRTLAAAFDWVASIAR